MASSSTNNPALDRIENDIAFFRGQLLHVQEKQKKLEDKDTAKMEKEEKEKLNAELAELKDKEKKLEEELADLKTKRDGLEAGPVVSLVSITEHHNAILQQAESLLFNIHSINGVNSYVGTGFFITETTAVTAKHVLQMDNRIQSSKVDGKSFECIEQPCFLKCSFSNDNQSTFHMKVMYISVKHDFVTLRLPSSEDLISYKLDNIRLTPRPFQYSSPHLGPCYTLAYHQIAFANSYIEPGIHIETGNITRVVSDGAIFSGNTFPGDSGSAVVMMDGKLVGMFVDMFTPVPSTKLPESPTEQLLKSKEELDKQGTEEQHRSYIIATANMVNSLHLTTNDLIKFKSHLNYLIDINLVLPYAM